MHSFYSSGPIQLSTVLRSRVRPTILFFAVLFLCTGFAAKAQAPTSLQYPSNSGFLTNASSVYLVPTLSGSTTGLSYSISPALPAGLALNTGTGVISGVPTAASAATTYTVTATNGLGSTAASFIITVTNSFFNNALGQVSFLSANRTFKIGNGQNAGDIALYSNVTTIGGQGIDCIVKTFSVSAGTTWDAYDQQAATGTYFNSNDDKFFSPQFNFSSAGNVIFDFQYILGGSYNNGTHTGTNITLQNVVLNSYDIDGNNNNPSQQYNLIAGFSKSELGQPTTLSAPSYDATLGLTRYMSGTNSNNATVTSPATRVRLTFNNMGSFRIQVGAAGGGLAYFFFDFSAGPSFTTPLESFAPSLDLNTSLAGTGNGAGGCASALSFSASGQTNVAAGTDLNELKLTYQNTPAHLPNGSLEQLVIAGATAGTASHSLNFGSGSTSSVTVGGVAYTITKAVSGSTNTIAFTTGSTFTVAQAEALLDALQYSNGAASPTNGDRSFTVNVRNTQYISPDAVFTASLNCVSIAGNVYHDANGLTDNTVNGNGSMGQFGAGEVYAVLTNALTNAVLATTPVAAGGAYTFGRRDPGTYNLFVSHTATPGATVTAASFPPGNYKSVGEKLGAGAGHDGLIDSKMTILLGTVTVSSANFGIQIPPTATNHTSGNLANPGGYNHYAIPAAAFVTADADGTVETLTISSFPTGANYLKVGSTIYTNGGTCPPQSSCTAWPGTLTIPRSAAGTLSVDPSSDVNTTVTLSYYVTDNGGFNSNNGTPTTITLPFTVPATPYRISGVVWNDANGNGVQEVTELLTTAASAGHTLYALLIQNTNTYSGLPTILATKAVLPFLGYSFDNVPAGNDYSVRIASLAAVPLNGAAGTTVVPALATRYVGVSTNNSGAIATGLNTANLVNALGVVSADKTSVHFGIQQTPTTTPFSVTIGNPAVNSLITLNGGANPPAFAGADPEDQLVNGSLAGRMVAITSLPTNGELWYNGIKLTTGADNLTPPSAGNPYRIPAYDPSKMRLKFTGTGYSSSSFSYAFVDAAGIMDPAPASYTLNWMGVLPVTLVRFGVEKDGLQARVKWQTANEAAMQEYVVERSIDGALFRPLATVAANGAASNDYTLVDDLQGLTSGRMYYRLKAVEKTGSAAYSAIASVRLSGDATLQLQVTPNPAKGPVTVMVSKTTAADGSLALYDQAGRQLVAKSIRLMAGTTALLLNEMQAFPNGTYFLRLTTNGSVMTQQVVLQR